MCLSAESAAECADVVMVTGWAVWGACPRASKAGYAEFEVAVIGLQLDDPTVSTFFGTKIFAWSPHGKYSISQ